MDFILTGKTCIKIVYSSQEFIKNGNKKSIVAIISTSSQENTRINAWIMFTILLKLSILNVIYKLIHIA